MERNPRQREQLTTSISQSDTGIDVVVERRNGWHFASQEEASHYFRRQYVRYKALHWGLHGLVAGGVLSAGYGVEHAIQTQNAFFGISAVITSGLLIIARELNARDVGRRVHLSKELRQRLEQGQPEEERHQE